ncbi:PSD1 and planctomycete cytochrome C domain-containing protein [Chryseolinea sp. H1M3-3]|uniref:PSD1 and planctomycete cytochrome C domain-containing protein n=1 Tax=Chryseolinea sp. H1M3-3 TaxID=3034144 RepID=UPI0023ED773B|nr:PSD1 and planctomycete cytochrome C domain-containing protein [Chryseolinea sp. H1M3-3]
MSWVAMGSSIMVNFWLWQFLGRLHPLIVHFPIGLLVVALVLEVFTLNKRNQELRSGINLLLIIGSLSAIAAVIFGLLLKTQDQYSGSVLAIHQWSGIVTLIFSLVTVALHRRVVMQNKKHLLKTYRAVLIITVLSVTVAGHYGASLTHGADFLTSVLPWRNMPRNADFDITQFTNDGSTPVMNAKQIADLNLEVRSIFAHNCYKCHSSEKIKGELRLDKKVFVMKGGKSGAAIVPGHPEESEMIRRLLLPREDEESMPPKGKTLSEKEIATLKLWIKAGAPWPDNADEKSVYRVAELAPRMPALPKEESGFNNPIDLFTNAYFKEKKIAWPAIVDDKIYIRRVYLDIIGLLPPPEAVEAFVKDLDPDKRAGLVKELLQRDDDYAQHWLTFWNDALRNDYTGTGYITEGRFSITQWLYESLKTNKSYDVFVKELISPNKSSEGFIRGIEWRGTVNASQRVEMQAAQNISQVFLGLNLKCASCHDSFISDLTLKQAYAFANIFSDTTLEINRCDVPTGEMAGTGIIFEELGTIDSTVSVDKKLKQLAEYLTSPKNGRLYRTIVNRIWSQLMGRGVIAPVDLMDNIPWSQDLLDWMASDFFENGNDIKQLIFTITTSITYQLPSVEIKSESELIADDYTFRGMHRRRLTAEQFADAVSAVVYPVYDDTLKVFNPIKKTASVSSASPFVRASLVKNDGFLTALGRPNRENVLTGRTTEANLLQALELTNGNLFTKVLKSGAKKWKRKYGTSLELIHSVYKEALSREPEPDEVKVALELLGQSPDDDSVEDFLWAVMLLPEFQLIY